MKTIISILFAFSMIIALTFLSDAISSNNPLSAQAQVNKRKVMAQRRTDAQPWLKKSNQRKTINYAKGSWTWKKRNKHVSPWQKRTIILQRNKRNSPALKQFLKNRKPNTAGY